MLAMTTALTALGIDLMLPAFDDMREGLGLAPDATSVTGLVTAYFVGLGVATIFYGPLADYRGRRFAVKLGLALYVVGAILTAVAPNLQMMLVARFLWGAGAAGPRAVAMAIVRDRFEGDEMARTMSTLMAIFILVPIAAPAVGSAILVVAPWRFLFVFCAMFALAIAVWIRRLPETLDEAKRLPDLRLDRVGRAALSVVRHRSTAAYAVAVTALYGVFTSYLGSSEAIVDRTLDLADLFPVIFGGLAAVMGAASLSNGRLVSKFGTVATVRTALPGYAVGAAVFLVVALVTDGRPSPAVFIGIVAVILIFHAVLIPNFNTLAMAPMGNMAGTASSVIGAFQLSVGALFGGFLDSLFDGSITPLAVGFCLSGVVASVALAVARTAGDQEPSEP